MLMFFALVLFSVQSISSWPLDNELREILNQDFSKLDRTNEKPRNLKVLEDTEYVNLRYYLELEGNFSETVFVSGFGQTWYFANGSQSRSQLVLYVDQNDTGIPVETIIFDPTEEYVIERGEGSIMCSIGNYSSLPALDYYFFGTRFIAPTMSDDGIIWGSRLVNMYYAIFESYTTVVVGLDAFTFDLVLFYYHYTLGEDLQEIIIVHDINYAPFSLDNLNVPSTIECLADAGDEKKYLQILRTQFPNILF